MSTVEMVSIAKVRVINARARSRAKFQEIVGNIATLGLKKPITISRRGDGDEGYDLVCGQGRLEAFAALGQTDVPAVIIDVPTEDRFLMGLIENLARRPRPTLELAREMRRLKDAGADSAGIAVKVGLSESYVTQMLRLINKGEERLVQAVEKGKIPLGIAVEIAKATDEETQRCLADAYQSGDLRGKALLQARRLVELRRARGKGLRGSQQPAGKRKAPSASDLVRAFKRENQRQELMVRKAHLTEQQLRFIVSALKELAQDEDFINLLRAEKLDEMPQHLAQAVGR